MALSAEQFALASTAQDDALRMFGLRRMDGAALRTLLSRDPAAAAPWIEAAGRQGLVEAQVRLGQMRLDGIGGARDAVQALRLFERAGRSGSPEAMNMAGRCHENGWGTAADLPSAARWYARSAEAGHDWGEYNLGHMYFDGRGVEQDLACALGWYHRAAAHGHARAMNLVARCYEQGWGAAPDGAQARLWYLRSAEGGYFRGQFNFATWLAAEGLTEEALEWLARAWHEAPPEGLDGMVTALLHHPDPRLSAFAARIGGGRA